MKMLIDYKHKEPPEPKKPEEPKLTKEELAAARHRRKCEEIEALEAKAAELLEQADANVPDGLAELQLEADWYEREMNARKAARDLALAAEERFRDEWRAAVVRATELREKADGARRAAARRDTEMIDAGLFLWDFQKTLKALEKEHHKATHGLRKKARELQKKANRLRERIERDGG
jgi:hypothetical protein